MSDQVATEERQLRADAVRNREKILAAAAQVFARRGLHASLDEIAAEAGVGVGTLYRRFPDKEALVSALFQSAIAEITSLATAALDVGNSWEGLVWFMEQVLQRQSVNQGLRDVVVGSPLGRELMATAKCEMSPKVHQLIARAQRDGYLRGDVVEEDFVIIESMISSFNCMSGARPPELWRRYLRIILDGLAKQRSEPSALPVEAPSVLVGELLTPRHLSEPRRQSTPSTVESGS